MKNNNFDIYAWACDLEDYRGEGILGRNFLKNLSKVKKNKSIFVETPESNYHIKNGKFKKTKKKKIKNLNLNFYYNYISPLIGILKIILFYKKKEKCFVNFLPLWNFIIFYFLPRNTILGPITGSVYYSNVKNFNEFLRKYLIPIFYKISIIICLRKNFKLLFSTELLKKYTKKIGKKKKYFNYNLINFENQKDRIAQRKDIDFLFYYRKYSAHDSSSQVNIIKNLSERNFKIVVIGNRLNFPNVKNKGIISRKSVFKILKKTKFSINEATNFYSIFLLDCVASGVKIFYNKKSHNKNFLLPKKYFLKIDFSESKKSSNIISKNIINYKIIKKFKFNKKIFLKFYKNYFT